MIHTYCDRWKCHAFAKMLFLIWINDFLVYEFIKPFRIGIWVLLVCDEPFALTTLKFITFFILKLFFHGSKVHWIPFSSIKRSVSVFSCNFKRQNGEQKYLFAILYLNYLDSRSTWYRKEHSRWYWWLDWYRFWCHWPW